MTTTPAKSSADGLRRLGSALFVVAGVVLLGLAMHRSEHPWVLGRYSLPFFLYGLALVGALFFLAALFRRFGPAAAVLVLAGGVTFGVVAVVAELAGQVYAWLHPCYQVLYLMPDRALGWKAVPGFQWTWAGYVDWYAREFSVPCRANAHGFVDVEHQEPKPAGVIRVAILGDSFVEAIQVPLPKRAARLLEQRLNAAKGANKYEVLNFGMSNFGVGQYLLAWEDQVRKFSPDYVLIFVGGLHMERTVTPSESGQFSATQGRQLEIRPAFAVENGRLVRRPARDYEEFCRLQEMLIQTEFGGARSRRRAHQFFLQPYLGCLGYSSLLNLQLQLQGLVKTMVRDVNAEVLAINLRILEELQQSVKQAGAVLAVMDVSQEMADWRQGAELSERLRAFCAERGIGYVPVDAQMKAARAQGLGVRWPRDRHFNETGNRVFADAMYGWLSTATTRE
ncbi:MAG: SGNH/GDSL hydrolase family protein [Verrucomicrobiae bacterium]|nr:SGNH/GDSL hydrolase family protein [Verrucomicrobiae bacterium]